MEESTEDAPLMRDREAESTSSRRRLRWLGGSLTVALVVAFVEMQRPGASFSAPTLHASDQSSVLGDDNGCHSGNSDIPCQTGSPTTMPPTKVPTLRPTVGSPPPTDTQPSPSSTTKPVFTKNPSTSSPEELNALGDDNGCHSGNSDIPCQTGSPTTMPPTKVPTPRPTVGSPPPTDTQPSPSSTKPVVFTKNPSTSSPERV